MKACGAERRGEERRALLEGEAGDAGFQGYRQAPTGYWEMATLQRLHRIKNTSILQHVKLNSLFFSQVMLGNNNDLTR